MNITRFTPQILLLAVFVWTAGCAGFIHHSDPLAGGSWKLDFHEQPSQVIEKDYQDYIQKEKLPGAIVDRWLEDGTGQHAITIQVGINGTVWRHILIYDKNDKRIKTIKYASGNYGS